MKGTKFKRLQLENQLQYEFIRPVFCSSHLRAVACRFSALVNSSSCRHKNTWKKLFRAQISEPGLIITQLGHSASFVGVSHSEPWRRRVTRPAGAATGGSGRFVPAPTGPLRCGFRWPSFHPSLTSGSWEPPAPHTSHSYRDRQGCCCCSAPPGRFHTRRQPRLIPFSEVFKVPLFNSQVLK